MSQNFPNFRKNQGSGYAINNLIPEEPSFVDIFAAQTQQTWLQNITASTYRATTYSDKEKEIYHLDEAYRQRSLDKTSGASSYVARGAGWLAGTLGDPTDLAMLVFSGGTASVATKGLTYGIKKRIAQGAIAGATYGIVKESLLDLDKEVDNSPLAKSLRVAETTVAFPLLGEAMHHAIRPIKNIFLKPTGSPHLDQSHKIESLTNTTTKSFVDETLPEFKTAFDQRTQQQVDKILSDTSFDFGKNIEQTTQLQDIKKNIRNNWGDQKTEYKTLNSLEDKIASGLITAEEEEQLVKLSHKHKDALVARDNQTKLIDILTVNRQILSQGEQRISPEIAEIVNFQIEDGKHINTSIQRQTLEHAKASIESSPIESIPKELTLANQIDPLLENELPELSKGVELLKTALESNPEIKALPKAIQQELQEITDIYTKQLKLNQSIGTDLIKDLSQYKDIRTGLRVLTNRISNESNGYYALTSNKIYNQLKKENLLKFFEKGSKYWGQELAILNKAPIETTGLNSAKIVAKILHEENMLVIARAKQAGIDITELAGRIVKQTHHKYKIQQDGFHKWKEYIKPLLDVERTNTSDNALLSSYNHIINPSAKKDALVELVFGNEKVKEIAHSMGINIGKAKSRSLHFKSLHASHLYNTEYGLHGWSKQFMVDTQQLTANIIKAEQLGIHPEHVLRYVRSSLDKAGVETTKDFVQSVLAPLNLDAHRHFNIDSASIWGDRLRAWTFLVMLGKSTISSLPDLFTNYVAARTIGSSRIHAIGSTMKGLVYMVKPRDRKDMLSLTNVVLEGALADMYNRMGMEVMQTGAHGGLGQRLTHLLYKVNFQSLWDESLKAGMSEGVAKYMGALTTKRFDSFPTALKSTLLENGITQENWSILSRTKLQDGFLLPHNITDKNLATKYQGFLIDIAHKGVPTGVRATDKYLMTGHKAADLHPIAREFITSWMQFKHFPIMICRHILSPAFRAATPLVEQKAGTLGVLQDLGSSPSVWLSSAALITGVISAEYIALQIKQVISGQKTLDKAFDMNEKDINDIVHKGAVLGIYQTFLNTMSSTPFDSNSAFIPAAVSPLKNTLDITKKIGDKDFVPTLIEKGIKNIPFNNLFYTDYLLKSSLGEYIEKEYPVYAHKHKKRFYKK